VTSRAQDTVTVPIQSVVERVPGEKASATQDEDKPKKKYVFLAKDSKTSQVEVVTGISDSTHVAILSGIKAGDEVITGPFRTLKKLNDGETVEVTREEKKASKDEDESSCPPSRTPNRPASSRCTSSRACTIWARSRSLRSTAST